jgi:hypothetical protein
MRARSVDGSSLALATAASDGEGRRAVSEESSRVVSGKPLQLRRELVALIKSARLEPSREVETRHAHECEPQTATQSIERPLTKVA